MEQVSVAESANITLIISFYADLVAPRDSVHTYSASATAVADGISVHCSVRIKFSVRATREAIRRGARPFAKTLQTGLLHFPRLKGIFFGPTSLLRCCVTAVKKEDAV